VAGPGLLNIILINSCFLRVNLCSVLWVRNPVSHPCTTMGTELSIALIIIYIPNNNSFPTNNAAFS
jgi:hypothetical protein